MATDDLERPELAAIYESVAGTLAPDVDTAALFAAVARAVARAKAEHPTRAVSSAQLVARIAASAGADAAALTVIDELFVADLLLAEACLHGDDDAVKELDGLLAAAVLPVLRRQLSAHPSQIDEIMQRVRVRILVGERDNEAKLRSYTGRGRLAAWARVVAVRVAYNLLAERDPGLASQQEESLVQAATDALEDPELQLLLTRYAPALTQAVQTALAALGQRERALLRLSLLDQLSIDQIGAIYGRDRSTAARWIARAKQALIAAARAEFCALTQASESEFFSLVDKLPGYFDMSLERLLEQAEGLALPA